MNRMMLRCLLLLAVAFGATASAAPTSEKDIDRLTDLVVKAMPFGVVFDAAQVKSANWPLEDKAPKATPAQLACLRGELSSAGYRRSKRADVAAYAEAHPGDVARDIELLDAGAAELFGKYILAGAQQEETGKPADIDGITASASAAQGIALVQLTTGEQYGELRRVIGFGSMFDNMKEDGDKMEKKGEAQGEQLVTMLMIHAVKTCQIPLSVFN